MSVLNWDEIKFTPTEELVLEVLQARMRLGEKIWTFDSRLGATVSRLEERGFVRHKHGVVENTLLAWLTPEGVALLFREKYNDQLGSKKVKRHSKELRARAKKTYKELKRKERESNGEA